MSIQLAQAYIDRGVWTGARIGYLMEEAAARWSDRPFLRFADARYSFGELQRWVSAVALDLVARGVQPGERVLIQASNCLELIMLHMAAWRIGAVSVPVVPVYRAHEMRAILDSTRPTVIAAARSVGSRTLCAELDPLLAELGLVPKARFVFGAGTPIAGWDRLAPFPDVTVTFDGVVLPEPAPPEACCMILFTSGTTSAPKGAMISSRAMLSGVRNWALGLEFSSHDVALAGAPLTHVAAMMSAFLVPLSVGARTVVLPGWNADRAVPLIAEERVTYMAGATVFLHDLIERYEQNPSVGHRISAFISGGAATPPSLIERAERLGIKASRVYGMTETCGPVVQSSASVPLAIRAHYDGRISYGAELQIVDDDHQPLPPGTLGEIRIRSPQMMDGYLDADITKAQIDGEGWFYPGDQGRLNEQGWLSFEGRRKDIINRGGEKFSSTDIEAALMAYAPILKAAVIGLPDARFGEVVCACLILRPGHAWQGPQAVLAHLDAFGLARPKFPVEWVIVDEFPTTATGKVQKQILLDIAVARRGASA